MTEEEGEYAKRLSEWMRELFGFEKGGRLWDNDWMLIIKLHAMIETALNHSISRHIGLPELSGVIAKLDTSNGATGKAAFAKALKILEKHSVAFLQKLSELRNLCVHDVRNFKFDLDKHLLSDGGEIGKAVAKEIQSPTVFDGRELTPAQLFEISPRHGLLIASMNVMVQLHLHDAKCRAQEAEAELVRLKAQVLDARDQFIPKES